MCFLKIFNKILNWSIYVSAYKLPNIYVFEKSPIA